MRRLCSPVIPVRSVSHRVTRRRTDQRLELFELCVCVDFRRSEHGWPTKVSCSLRGEGADHQQVFGSWWVLNPRHELFQFCSGDELQFGNGAALVITAARVAGALVLEDQFRGGCCMQCGSRHGDGEAEQDGREFHTLVCSR